MFIIYYFRDCGVGGVGFFNNFGNNFFLNGKLLKLLKMFLVFYLVFLIVKMLRGFCKCVKNCREVKDGKVYKLISCSLCRIRFCIVFFIIRIGLVL